MKTSFEDETFRLLCRIHYFDMKSLLYQRVWNPKIPYRRLENEEIVQLLSINGWTKDEYIRAEKDYGDML